MSPESYIATLGQFCGTYVPKGWIACEGQTLEILKYGQLYNLLKDRDEIAKTVGTFNVPDLRPKDLNGEPIDWFTAGIAITCICYEGIYPEVDKPL